MAEAENIGIYEKICCIENLLPAWAKVKSKGSAGGIDKITIEMFEPDLDKNLKELSSQLSAYKYIPELYIQKIKDRSRDGNE